MMKRSENGPQSFQVTPTHRFSGECPFFRKPAEVGNFSLDGQRGFHDDARQLRYYVPPFSSKFDFDLRQGYSTCVQKDDDIKERLTHLLTWINKHRDIFQLNNQDTDHSKNGNKSLNTDFISWRGHFTKLLCTPYQLRDPWTIAATLHNGTIFLSEVETEKSRNERVNRSKRHQEMCYWGYKFEDYVTTPVKDEYQTTDIVNTNEAYCSIVRTRLNKHSILVGAEVDCCVKGNNGKSPDNYIELKTTRRMDSEKQKINFAKYKLLKFWGQSFLAGVPKIIVGMRNDDGIVTQLKTYNTLDIPRIKNTYPNIWEASVCMNFLDSFLNWCKELVVKDDINTVYMLSFDHPFEKVTVRVTHDGSERFLPDWFVSKTS